MTHFIETRTPNRYHAVIMAAIVAFLPSIFSLKSEEDILDINTSANRFASIK